jgi:uncharacterized iron-regulated protein
VPARLLRDEIALNRRVVARLRGELARSDPAARSAYVQAFRREFRHPATLSSMDDLVIACFKADLVYVGDFHALGRSQDFAARLLDEITRRSRRTCLAVEMVYGRHQEVLDQWMAGRISEEEFLARIRYDQEWGYDWQAFRKVFEVARARGLRVHGIDVAPRAGMRHIRARDRHMAERIAGLFEQSPDAKVVVMVGESHLATGHLPRAVRAALARRNMERRAVRVLQNLEEVYWQLVARGEEHAEVVVVGRNVFCCFTASPLEKYEAYRQVLEAWDHDRPGDDEPDLTPTVHNMIDTILRFLGIDKYRRTIRRDGGGAAYLVDAYPEVYTEVDAATLTRRLAERRFRQADIADVLHEIGRNGSCYIPGVNAIYIGTLSLVHGGEEAAHFVNHALRGDLMVMPGAVRPTVDVFYGAVIAEALGFFGSKIIDPSRNHFFETEFYRYYRKSREVIESKTGFSFEDFNEIIEFILLHKKFERAYASYDEVPEAILRGIRTRDRRRFSILTHELGYFLGQQLYDGLRAGAIGREEVAGLFARRLERRGEALELYLDLSARLPGGIPPG